MTATRKTSRSSADTVSAQSPAASLPKAVSAGQAKTDGGQSASTVTRKPKVGTTQVANKTTVASTLKPAAKKLLLKKTTAKKLSPKTAKAANPAKVLKKVVKEKKPKLIRDSFTIPKAEYEVLEVLKDRAAKLARPVKKSELLRAGIKALAALSGAAFLTALNQVPTIKTGRPSLKS